MPKKWIRDARRKAREESYRLVDPGAHALSELAQEAEDDGDYEDGMRLSAQSERLESNPTTSFVLTNEAPPRARLGGAVLPVYKRENVRWLECGTSWAYLTALLAWADDARDYVFNGNEEDGSKWTPERAAALAALRIAVSSWVIRSTKVRVRTSYLDAFFRKKSSAEKDYDFIGSGALVVTSRLTGVGTSSMETEHELWFTPNGAPKGTHLATVSGTIVPIDPRVQKPIPMSESLRELLKTTVMGSPSIAPRPAWPAPTSSSANAVTASDAFRVRRTDCDAFEHLNNCLALNLFLEALPDGFAMENVTAYSIEYPTMMYAKDAGRIEHLTWSNERGARFWRGTMLRSATSETETLRAWFTDDPQALILRLEKPSL